MERAVHYYLRKPGEAESCVADVSGVEWTHTLSIAIHSKAGFEEVNRIVCFVKALS